MLSRLVTAHLKRYPRLTGALVLLQLLSVAASLYLPSLNADVIDKGVTVGDTETSIDRLVAAFQELARERRPPIALSTELRASGAAIYSIACTPSPSGTRSARSPPLCIMTPSMSWSANA